MKVEFNPADQRLTVRVDRTRIVSDGKPALGQMLLKLHIYRCTADVKACREYYEDLASVDGVYLQWREVVIARAPPKWTFVHANTFLKDGGVVLKEYSATREGIVQSWADRAV
jgi:dipeptidyl-peptidase-3